MSGDRPTSPLSYRSVPKPDAVATRRSAAAWIGIGIMYGALLFAATYLVYIFYRMG